MEATIDTVGLQEMLPSSIADDEQVRAAVRSLQQTLTAVITERRLPIIFGRIDELTSEQLDHVAVMFDISTWRDTWTVELKRSVLRMIVQEKCRMGTLSAVREAISSLGTALTITEWWQQEPKGVPHTFVVDAVLSSINGVFTTELQEDLMQLLDEAKPARALYTFNLRQANAGGITFTGAARCVSVRRLKNF